MSEINETSCKHIVVVTQYFYPENFRINDICLEWIERGYKVTVITAIPNYPQGKFYEGYGLMKKRKENWNGIDIIRLPVIPRGSKAITLVLNYFSFVVSGYIWKLTTKIDGDSVFIFGLSPATLALPGVWYAKKKKIPCIYYVQDLWPDSVESVTGVHNPIIIQSIGKVMNYIYKNCDYILATSKSYLEAIEKRNVEKEKLKYWPQYAETFYQPIKIDNNKGKLFVVTFTGNIGYGQGLEILPEVAGYIDQMKTEKKIMFQIIGDGRYLESLKKEIQQHKVEAYFDFVGRKSPEAIPSILAESDAALLCLAKKSLFSMTIPAKLQSYMACGKPIVAAVSGESARVIDEAKAGLCSEAGDAEALAKNISMLSGKAQCELDLMGKNAKLYSDSRFNKQALMDEIDTYLGGRNELQFDV